MWTAVERRSFVFLVPGGVSLLAGWWFSQHPATLHRRLMVTGPILSLAPLSALLLGWRFNRNKPAFLVFVLFLAEPALRFFT